MYVQCMTNKIDIGRTIWDATCELRPSDNDYGQPVRNGPKNNANALYTYWQNSATGVLDYLVSDDERWKIVPPPAPCSYIPHFRPPTSNGTEALQFQNLCVNVLRNYLWIYKEDRDDYFILFFYTLRIHVLSLYQFFMQGNNILRYTFRGIHYHVHYISYDNLAISGQCAKGDMYGFPHL